MLLFLLSFNNFVDIRVLNSFWVSLCFIIIVIIIIIIIIIEK